MRTLLLFGILLLSPLSFASDWQLVIQTPAIVIGPEHSHHNVYRQAPAALVVRAPLVHQQYWPQYCHEYNACHQHVRFITAEPVYAQRHWHAEQHRHDCNKHKRRHKHKRHHHH